MLEHLSSLRRKNSESAQATTIEKQPENDHKEMSDMSTVNSKSKNSIFKILISAENGTNIFQKRSESLNFALARPLEITALSVNTILVNLTRNRI